jgi:hypothetical protein
MEERSAEKMQQRTLLCFSVMVELLDLWHLSERDSLRQRRLLLLAKVDAVDWPLLCTVEYFSESDFALRLLLAAFFESKTFGETNSYLFHFKLERLSFTSMQMNKRFSQMN